MHSVILLIVLNPMRQTAANSIFPPFGFVRQTRWKPLWILLASSHFTDTIIFVIVSLVCYLWWCLWDSGWYLFVCPRAVSFFISAWACLVSLVPSPPRPSNTNITQRSLSSLCAVGLHTVSLLFFLLMRALEEQELRWFLFMWPWWADASLSLVCVCVCARCPRGQRVRFSYVQDQVQVVCVSFFTDVFPHSIILLVFLPVWKQR